MGPSTTSGTSLEVGAGLDHLGFKVAALDKSVEEAKVAGYPVVQVIKAGTSRWVYIHDPNGIWIELSTDSSVGQRYTLQARSKG